MIEIRRSGPLSTVQDLGRPGWAHLGVPRSGALDRPALRLANRLVGNPDGAAGLELTASAFRCRLASPRVVALTGAYAQLTVSGRHAGYGVPVPVPAGSELAIGAPTHGVRCYLAISGGVAVPPVLGSRSTDTLSGLGPAALRGGDVLPLGEPHGTPSRVDFIPGSAGGGCWLRVSPGPRRGWFAAQAWDRLLGSPYLLRPESNRVGARLSGPELVRAIVAELPSEGMVDGAVQVPADGQPLVFLADHPTTGGYPVIAVVAEADLPRLAQLRPGEQVRFAPYRGG